MAEWQQDESNLLERTFSHDFDAKKGENENNTWVNFNNYLRKFLF